MPSRNASIGICLPYAEALISILLSSAGQILFKLLMRHQTVGLQLFTQPLFYAGFLAYGISAVIWLQVLSRLPLVVAYPLVSLNFILVALAGTMVLHEQVSWRMWLGLGLIIGGIMVITQA
jgi:undecaprenyl phosphate-alpha-L-ara4N flippase subunit ArnE